jgi:hypothetical protein
MSAVYLPLNTSKFRWKNRQENKLIHYSKIEFILDYSMRYVEEYFTSRYEGQGRLSHESQLILELNVEQIRFNQVKENDEKGGGKSEVELSLPQCF